MPKTFKNVEKLINYYRYRTTTGTEVKLEIDGTVRTFVANRGSRREVSRNPFHSHRLYDVETLDNHYKTVLVINFVRFFVDKMIAEAYFLITSWEPEQDCWISPIFFDHDELADGYFVCDSDFDEYDTGLENETKTFLGRRWVNIYVHSDAFVSYRIGAYKSVAKTFFYTSPKTFEEYKYLHPEARLSIILDGDFYSWKQWNRKYLVSRDGKSELYEKPVEPPDDWF
ncbi:hypothetical protein LLE49_07315 [Alicyclobacillus tolerans]|uniref:hypothetical protein n=1 Tax=Alicyclobacillus tolerans TaxID=90970 RepID=UPI001F2545AB|nr:hypothetical protein [Alicyclobacillus tolerans]MCF8564553.1 hypothetical protein [Alicyclobacillus tolerans]